MSQLLIWTFSGTASSSKFVTTDRCKGCMLWFLTSSIASNKLSWNQSLCWSSWLSWTVESCWNIYWATFSVSVYQSSSSSFSFSFSFFLFLFLSSLSTPSPFSSCFLANSVEKLASSIPMLMFKNVLKFVLTLWQLKTNSYSLHTLF